MKSAVETLSPTRVKLTVEVPYDELKPSIDQGVQGRSAARSRSRASARARCRRASSTSASAAGRCSRRPSTRPAQLLPPGRRGDQGPPARPARGRHHRRSRPGRGRRAEVHRRGRRAARDRAARLLDPDVQVDDVEVADEDVDERLERLRERFGTLVGVDRPAAEGDFVTIDLTARSTARRSTPSTGVSYQVGSGNMLEGMDEALTGLSAGETTTFTSPLAGGEHAGEDADGRGHRPVGQGARAARGGRRLRPAGFRVRHPRRAARRPARKQAARPRVRAGRRRPATASWTQLLEPVEVPVPDGVVEAEVDRTSRARAAWRTTSTAPRSTEDDRQGAQEPDPARRRRREGRGRGRAERADRVPRETAHQYGMDPNAVRPGRGQQAGQVPRWWPRSPAARRSPSCCEQATVTDRPATPSTSSDLVPPRPDAEELGRRSTTTTRRGPRRRVRGRRTSTTRGAPASSASDAESRPTEPAPAVRHASDQASHRRVTDA